MATRGVSMTVQYTAWDTSANGGKTGDVANHTLRWIKDGVSAAPTNSPSEIDAVNAPGQYSLVLTAAEADANLGTLAGASSTADTSIIPTKIEFERLPDAAPAAAGGVPTANASNFVAGVVADVGITQAGADKVWLTSVRALTDKVGFALSTAGILAIWNQLTSALGTAGTIGKLLVDNINATISSRSTFDSTTQGVNTDRWAGTNTTISATTAKPEIDVASISDEALPAINLQNQYNTTGLLGATFPANQGQLDQIGSGTGSAINRAITGDNTVSPIKGVPFVGVQVEGTFNDLRLNDGNYHRIGHTGNAIDIVYECQLGTDQKSIEIQFLGYLSGGNDEIDVFVYNFLTTAFEKVGQIQGQNGTNDVLLDFPLYDENTGTDGADFGKTYIEFVISGQTAPQLNSQQLVIAARASTSTLGYQNGAVWVDTVNGFPGVAPGTGTHDRPSNNYGDAKTIADSLSLRTFRVLSGSSDTLAEAFEGYNFIGTGYSINLGGQSFSGSDVVGADVVGNDSGVNAVQSTYSGCRMTTNVLGLHKLKDCSIEGGITLAEPGIYIWVGCYSAAAIGSPPFADYGVSVGNVDLRVNFVGGGLSVRNMGQAGSDSLLIDGFGKLVIEASCTGGTLERSGSFLFTDNSGGAVTVNPDDNTEGITQIQTDLPITITKNVALNNFHFFMVQSSDHVTPAAGLTFSAGDATRAIDGGSFANTANLPTEVGNGVYRINLAASDLNGDTITFVFKGAAADQRTLTIKTQPT